MDAGDRSSPPVDVGQHDLVRHASDGPKRENVCGRECDAAETADSACEGGRARRDHRAILRWWWPYVDDHDAPFNPWRSIGARA